MITNERMASMAAWDIATAFGCGYSGDYNPVEHGGFFYNKRDWLAYGYASCVEFWHDPEQDDVLVVQRGTVHKLKDMEAAFKCCGIEAEVGNVDAEIEACRSYGGIEPDGTRYPDLMTYRLADWRERNIWKSVRGWIEELGECLVNREA